MSTLIQSVTRALRILDALATHPEGLSAKQIAEMVGLHASTTHHLVNTLVADDYVLSGNGTYRLGHAIPRLYGAFLVAIKPDERLQEILYSLAKVTKETAYIGAWHNGDVVIQAIVEGKQAVRVGGLHVGYSGHTYARASGKAVLAYLSQRELDEYLASHSLTPLTPNTVRTEEDLRAELSQIAVRGYAIDREQFADGVCCIAAPVFSVGGKVEAVLTVSAPTGRFERNEEQLVNAVVEAANEASAILGFSPISARTSQEKEGEP